jgi:hypothetical protein
MISHSGGGFTITAFNPSMMKGESKM